MDINELLKDVKSFNKEAAMKENMRMVELKDNVTANAFRDAQIKLASYVNVIKIDSPESNLTEFSRNKLSGKMKAMLSVSTTAGLKRLPIHFVVKASVPTMVETPEQVVAALDNVEGSIDKEVKEILEKQKQMSAYHNDDIEVKAEDEDNSLEGIIDAQLKADGLSKTDFTDKVDVNFYISLLEYGVVRNPQDGMTLLGSKVGEDEFGNPRFINYDYNYISVDDVKEALSDIEEGFWSYIGEENPEQVLNTLDNNNLSYWIMSINQYNGYFSPTASAIPGLVKKASKFTVQAKKKEINLVNRENTAASQFPVKLLVYPKTYLPELKKGDVVNVGGFKYKYIGDEPLLNGDTENGINARFELMRTDKKASLNKKAEAEEDTEKCAICEEYFPVSDMINEVDFGHVCDNCFRGLKSRGEDLYKKAADDKKENKSKKSEEDEDKEQRDKDFKDKLKFMQEEKHFEDLDPSQLMAMVTTYRYYHMLLPKEALDAISQSADSASRYMSSFDSLEEAFEEATPKIIERVVSSPKYLVGVLKNYSDDINFDTLPKQVKDKLMGDVVALVEVVKAAPSLLTEEVAEKIIKESPTEAETIYSTFGTVEEKGKGWDKIKEWAEEKKLDQAPTNEEIGIAQDDQPYKPNVKKDKSVDDDYAAMGTEEDSEPYNPSNKEEILGPNKNDLQVEDEEDKKASVDTTIKKEADATEFSTSLENVDLDISNIFIVRQLKESGIEVGFEYNEDVTKKLYAINKVSSNEFLKWNFDFSGSEQGIEYFRVVVPNQTIKVNVEYYTPEEYSNENGGDTTTSEIQIPLSNVKVDMHSMNTLEGMTLYPLSIEVDDNGGVEVSF